MVATSISSPSGLSSILPSANIDLTITISVIIALCAIISPVLTSIINNRHNYRIRKMELDYDSRKERFMIHYQNKSHVFADFLQSARDYRIERSDTSYEKLLSSANTAKLYCNNPNSVSDIDEFLRLLTIRQFAGNELSEINKYKDDLKDVTEALNKELISTSLPN